MVGVAHADRVHHDADSFVQVRRADIGEGERKAEWSGFDHGPGDVGLLGTKIAKNIEIFDQIEISYRITTYICWKTGVVVGIPLAEWIKMWMKEATCLLGSNQVLAANFCHMDRGAFNMNKRPRTTPWISGRSPTLLAKLSKMGWICEIRNENLISIFSIHYH